MKTLTSEPVRSQNIIRLSGRRRRTPTTLVSFNGDGYYPNGGLVADAAGDLFGTTEGGQENDGTVFELTDAGLQTVPCFMKGTLIGTAFGARPVETVRRGDLILTLAGRELPIRWVGRKTVSAQFGDPLRVLPIRIKAKASGDNMPSRDLLLSPDHAILIDELLIQAGALVNGTSITREANVPETFIYYHVELDDHSLIVAENTPAETFIDNMDRLCFDNWVAHGALYPEGRLLLEMPYPRAKAYRQVPQALRQRLAERGDFLNPRGMRAPLIRYGDDRLRTRFSPRQPRHSGAPPSLSLAARTPPRWKVPSSKWI
jgi:hypothetical protein